MMKKCYECPDAEKMTVISENVMQASGEEITDNEGGDNLHEIARLIESLQK